MGLGSVFFPLLVQEFETELGWQMTWVMEMIVRLGKAWREATGQTAEVPNRRITE